MNQLNKLIQQYERENHPWKAVSYHGETGNMYSDKFVQWQATQIETLASRPICGKEQRKFLDEVEKLEYQQGLGYKYENEYVFLSKNFKQINLQKVIKGE